MFIRFSVILSLLTALFFVPQKAVAQNVVGSDSVSLSNDNKDLVQIDSIDTKTATIADTLKNDTINPQKSKPKKSFIDDPIHYKSEDSLTMFMNDKRMLLFGNGNVKYQESELTAEYIESDLDKKQITASGVEDTNKVYNGKPLLKQGDEEFNCDSLRMNTESGKAIIHNVKSEQGEGYLHSDLTKRDSEGNIHVKGGKYTTCDSDHPHFYMELTKAIVIPDDKIVTGPAYLVVEDIPLPMLGLPFGFFPNSRQRGAGIIMPKIGEEANRGFHLQNGGWYQPLGQHLDLTVLGSWYSKGSWALQVGTSYKVRYKYNGDMRINYNVNDIDDDENPPTSAFKWTWSHSQDPKANPTQSLRANVNFSSSGFDRNYADSYNRQNIVSNQTTSSISYTKNWPGTPFNLSISANARQNKSDSSVSLDLPTGSFNAKTMYPFRNKKGGGKYKWYENIGLSYNSQFAGKLSTMDTALMYRETWEDMNTGFSHSIPFVINLKTDKIKMLTISPSLNYKGVLYNWYTEQRLEAQTVSPRIVTDTIHEFRYAHAINPSISFGLSPKLYALFNNTLKDPNVIAVRYLMQPRATFSYTPDMRMINPSYYDTISYMENGELKEKSYSYFGNNMYGTPSSNGKNASLSLSVGNSLEMKMKPKNDTTGKAEPRKVSLIRSLSASTSYKPYNEEFKWADISVNGSSSLFKNKLNLQVNAKFSPYDLSIDSSSTTGTVSIARVDEFYYQNKKGLIRFTGLGFNAGFSLKSKQGDDDKDENIDNMAVDDNIYQDPLNPDYEFVPGYSDGTYVDFSIPWTLSVNYQWNLSRPLLKETQNITQTVSLRGDFSLTPKWKIGFNTGYDFELKKIVMTNINVHRDLHCWEMTFSIVPFGTYKNYSFIIRAKSSILRDLKVDKKQSWYDNF